MTRSLMHPILRSMIDILLAITLAGIAIGNAEAAEPEDSWRLCAHHADDVEKSRGLPPLLLIAISKVEAGRWRSDTSEVVAWPWTVTAEGNGKYLPSKEAAIREVRRLHAMGVENIDVGCMQINLMYHPEAFQNLEQALDPAQNIGYAAGFLSGLQSNLSSWTRAIGRYHSASPEFSGSYRFKVLRAWRQERQRAWRIRQAQVAG